ncbi:MAG: hypothetical protein BWX48_01159 [Verrucomicrobia bacterium ADurb.Bin006]|nr:MAG: hypothetical protein BWX48_01131 [Verrucomicrobia bacterium ADurb.Bin006]OQC66993.1 MAG: hypothetical protein BWX48_01159 [Verrucomicrobia bacterium ADurb.Bin006]
MPAMVRPKAPFMDRISSWRSPGASMEVPTKLRPRPPIRRGAREANCAARSSVSRVALVMTWVRHRREALSSSSPMSLRRRGSPPVKVTRQKRWHWLMTRSHSSVVSSPSFCAPAGVFSRKSRYWHMRQRRLHRRVISKM